MFEAWKKSFFNSLTHSWDGVAALLPNLLAALLVLLVGLVVAVLVRRLVILVAKKIGLDEVSRKVGFEDLISQAGIKSSSAEIIAKVLFWVIFLSFLVSATETIGLQSLSRTIHSLVLYLPKIVGSLLILILGFILAAFARKVILKQFERLGILYSKGIAGAVYGLLILVAGTMAVSQLEIETDLLKQVISIALVTVGLGLALTVGLGTRGISKNLLAGIYARDLFQPGAEIQTGDHRGHLLKIGTVMAEIETADGEVVHVPNSTLIETSVHVAGKTDPA
jgi:small-conductance mechanosensitive channel